MKRLKVGLSPYMDRLLEGVATSMGKSKTAALDALLYRIELMARHGKLGESLFGLEWIEVATNLQLAGMGYMSDSVTVTGEEVKFDVQLLERSGRSKTGFAGVFATGSAFRALVPDPAKGESRYLPSRATAIQAAIDRYEWYQKHALPYGELGKHTEEVLYRNPGTTMYEVLEEARSLVGKHKCKFTLEQVDTAYKRYCELHGPPPTERRLAAKPETAKPIYTSKSKPATKAKAKTAPVIEPPVEVPVELAEVPVELAEQEEACAVCQEPIRATDRFTFLGKTDEAVHMHCLDHLGQPRPKNQTATP